MLGQIRVSRNEDVLVCGEIMVALTLFSCKACAHVGAEKGG